MPNPRSGAGYDAGSGYALGQTVDVGNRLDAKDTAGYTMTPMGARAAYAVNALQTRAGYSLQGAAQLVGGFMKESPNLNADQIQGRDMSYDPNPTAGEMKSPVNGVQGYGIAQWTDKGRQKEFNKFLAAQDPNLGGLTASLMFAAKEIGLPEYGRVEAAMYDPSISARAAQAAALRGYERPFDQSEKALQERMGLGFKAKDLAGDAQLSYPTVDWSGARIDGQEIGDFGAPVWNGTWTGPQAPAPKSYDPLSSVSAPAPSAPAPQDAGLNNAMFSGAPMGGGQTFGSFTPSFTDKSTFSGAYSAPSARDNAYGVAPTVAAPSTPSASARAYSAPSARDNAYGVAPTVAAPSNQDPLAGTQAMLSVSKPSALNKTMPLAAAQAATAAIAPPAPQVAYEKPNPRDDMYGVAPTIPAPAANINIPLPPEPAPMTMAPAVPAMPAPRMVTAPKVAAVSAPQKAPKIAPSRPAPAASSQTQATAQSQDPVSSFSQQVGTPQNFMGMNPKDFGMAVGTLAALSPNAQKINALASQVGDPRVGIVAQNALQNEYAALTGQPQTKSLWGGLMGDISQAFGFTPAGMQPDIRSTGGGYSYQSAALANQYGVDSAGFSPGFAAYNNAGGGSGIGPGTSGLW